MDKSVIVDTLKRKYCLTDEETEIIFNFLAKYFLEIDESGKKARPLEEFCNLYKEN